MKSIFPLSFFLALTVMISGCGGGGTTQAASPPSSPDTTAPTTTVALAVSGTTDHTTNLSVTINENGTGYYLVQPSAVSAPAASAVMAASSVALTANVPASQAINGLTFNTSYDVYFIAKDAANNVQSAVQSAPVTTLLTSGYQVQAGLTWSPVNYYGFGSLVLDWVRADAFCSTTTINGLTGWRLPTAAELSALGNSGNAYVIQYWTGWLWSSTPGATAGTHYSVLLAAPNGPVAGSDAGNAEVTCVR